MTEYKAGDVIEGDGIRIEVFKADSEFCRVRDAMRAALMAAIQEGMAVIYDPVTDAFTQYDLPHYAPAEEAR